MQNINELSAISSEAKEFAKNLNKASMNFLALVKISLKRSAYYINNVLRLFFLRPKVKRMIKPGVFEEVNFHPPPPSSSPPKFF
tara:strand:- start:571 stop:822 length:252 start_codon:yes stop_codon:yes gene_type:complete